MQIWRYKGELLSVALGLIVLAAPSSGQDKPKPKTGDVLNSIREGNAKGGDKSKGGGLKPVEGMKGVKEKIENGGQPPLTTRPGGRAVEKKPTPEAAPVAGQEGKPEAADDAGKAAERGTEKGSERDADKGAGTRPLPVPGKPGAGQPGGPNPRGTMQRMGAAIRVHEVRMARLDALAAVFEGKSESDKLARVTELRKREDERYQAELATFKDALGEETYKKVLAGLRITRKGGGLQKGKPSVDMKDPKAGGDRAPKPEETRKEAGKERGAPAPVQRKKEGGQ